MAKAIDKPVVIKNTVLREPGYTYIKPILLCNINTDQTYNENTLLSNQISNYVQKNSRDNISVYYLSLGGGGWASVNGDETFSPASMLKVPTVVEALKAEENNPGLESTKLYYDGSFNDNLAEHFQPPQSITPGNRYSIDDLITSTIVYSDNNALKVLEQGVASSTFDKLYKDLGITIPTNTIDFMSAKTYTLFLRVLYNSTYLTREDSEKVLQLMTSSDFPNGLRAGVPATVPVAQKFGERQVSTTSGAVIKRELHDCGIVYVPGKPYILCVMTSGQNWSTLTSYISSISKLVYDSVTK